MSAFICSRRCAKTSDSCSTCEVRTPTTVSVAAREVVPPANRENSTNTLKSHKVRYGGTMRIQVDPEAREGLLEFLRRAGCEVREDGNGDGSVIVEVPD